MSKRCVMALAVGIREDVDSDVCSTRRSSDVADLAAYVNPEARVAAAQHGIDRNDAGVGKACAFRVRVEKHPGDDVLAGRRAGRSDRRATPNPERVAGSDSEGRRHRHAGVTWHQHAVGHGVAAARVEENLNHNSRQPARQLDVRREIGRRKGVLQARAVARHKRVDRNNRSVRQGCAALVSIQRQRNVATSRAGSLSGSRGAAGRR